MSAVSPSRRFLTELTIAESEYTPASTSLDE
jgi:hypothetical protein